MMPAFSVDKDCPLSPVAIAYSDIINGEATLDVNKFKIILKQALKLYEGHQTQFNPGRTFNLEHNSEVKTSKCLPDPTQSSRLARCAWHARNSIHDSKTLTYEDFYEGLCVDHPVKEKEYIHDIMRYERVGESISSPVLDEILSAFIAEVRADIWVSEYKLPIITSNRDFVELFLTIELKPHANPLSKEHIDSVIEAIDGKSTQSNTEAGSQRKSAINIQLPISTSKFEPQRDFVRAFYSSVEVIRELEQGKTEWWMAVQSDSAGRVPLMFQEMAMPSKIAPDVSSFIGWAVKQKSTTST